MKPESQAPGVCPMHRLLDYAEVEAKIDAEKMRQQAEPNSPQSFAQAKRCDHSTAWHIFVPTKGRTRTILKRARKPVNRRD